MTEKGSFLGAPWLYFYGYILVSMQQRIDLGGKEQRSPHRVWDSQYYAQARIPLIEV